MRSSSCNNKLLSFIIMLSFTIIKSRKNLEDLELRFLNSRKLKITYSIHTNSNILDSAKKFLKHYLVFDCKEAWTSFKFRSFYWILKFIYADDVAKDLLLISPKLHLWEYCMETAFKMQLQCISSGYKLSIGT